MDPVAPNASEALRVELEELIGYELTDPRIDVASVAERSSSLQTASRPASG